MCPQAKRSELTDLLMLLCDGDFGQLELGRLEHLLLGDPEAQTFYQRFIALDEELAWNVGSPPQPSIAGLPWPGNMTCDQAEQQPDVNSEIYLRQSLGPSTLPTISSPSPSCLSTTLPATLGCFPEGMPLAYSIATLITGLGLLVGSLIPAPRTEQVARQSVSLPSPLSPLPSMVGRITGMVDCKWEKKGSGVGGQGSEITNLKSQIRNPKSPVALGDKFALRSGLMEITYDTGAKVILQGPVTYSVEANGGYLAVGKLTGKLEKRGERRGERGEGAANRQISNFKSQSLNPSSLSPLPSPLFVIRTPTVTVTDLGTMFGIEVRKNGSSEVHVITGVVDVVTQGGVGRVRLSATGSQTAARVEAGSRQIVMLSAAPQRFVQAMPQRPRTLGSQLRWRPQKDAGDGFVLVCADQSFPVDGTVTQFSFCDYGRGDDRTQPRWITPLIFAKEGEGRFVLTGIGESITSRAKGVQRRPFRLLAGSAEVKGGKHTFGHFDGAVAADGPNAARIVSHSLGVTDMEQDSGPWHYSFAYHGSSGTSHIRLGDLFVMDDSLAHGDGKGNQTYPLRRADSRTYSSQMTVQPGSTATTNHSQ